MRVPLQRSGNNTERAQRKRQSVAVVRPALERPVRDNIRVRAQVGELEITGELVHEVNDDAH